MKFLVLFACVAAASAVELVTYPSGAVAPAKTPEVVAAEAAHFAAKGLLAPVAYAGAYAGYPYGYAGWNGYYGGYGYPYHHAGALVAYANGAVAPAKTPEVVAAEVAHFAAHGIAPVAPAAYAYAPGYPYVAHPGLVAHPNGAVVPVEPADVVAAREEHLAAHAAA